MESQENKFYEIFNHSLPSRFDFYHLGWVQIKADLKEHAPDELLKGNFDNDFGEKIAISFKLYATTNENQFLILFIFDQVLDHDLYTEMGNVLVSKIATQLSSATKTSYFISPPSLFNQKQISKLQLKPGYFFVQAYKHILESTSDIELKAIILPIESEVGLA